MIALALGAALTIYDLVEVELAYTSIVDRAYRPVASATLLDGARRGMIDYLRARGVAQPQVGVMRARADGRGAVPAIDREIALAIRRYGARVEPRPLAYAIARGELAALHDPYAAFFTPKDLASFQHAIDGETFGGIGAVIVEDPEHRGWRVDDVFPGGPADKAGLHGGDLVAAIDGVSLAGVPLDVARVRGKTGTTLRLTVTRDAASQELAIVRAAVTPPDVSSRLYGTTGYVALRGFGPTAAPDVRRAVAALDARGATATVLDLRGNPGGYESEARKVASIFIASGPIVAVEERGGKRRTENATGHALPLRPIVVLVDHDSASGSELVAAALRERAGAKLAGATTFGKGLVQEITPLPDGAAMKFTTARYMPPSGRDLNGVGLTPDIPVTQPAEAQRGVPGHDPQLDAALAAISSGGSGSMPGGAPPAGAVPHA